jgi:hypothetical protein
MLVNFMVIGAQKAGTTSLSYQLSQHPQISFCKHKEPDFFSKTKNWRAELDVYHDLYEKHPDKVYGEGSTTYSWIPEYPDVAQKIHEYNPDVKLIYLMRHPVERLISHYTHHLLRARTKYPPEVEVLEVPTYINHSRYAMQLRPYLELFPRENILLLLFEEYIKDPLMSLRQIAVHVGVNPQGFDGVDLRPQYQSLERTGDRKIKKWLTPFGRLLPLQIRNALRGPFVYRLRSKPEFSVKSRKLLWRFFEDDVRSLEVIMGCPLDLWRKSPYW